MMRRFVTISIAMALASAGPIQIGRIRAPDFSRRITTGALVLRSSPRWATVSSIIAVSASELPERGAKGGGAVGTLPGEVRVGAAPLPVERGVGGPVR